MKILIKAYDSAVAERIKVILASYDKGLRLFTRDDGISYYKCVISIGKRPTGLEADIQGSFNEPADEGDWKQLESELWAFYRDNLKEAFGGKCSCGLYEFCHCH
ncbi:MAG: hypothetical protein HUJ96_08605 [Marinilabiliaceae bacterium]|nr:hypothetical protein [Marinilabiliaceae bacterium]